MQSFDRGSGKVTNASFHTLYGGGRDPVLLSASQEEKGSSVRPGKTSDCRKNGKQKKQKRQNKKVDKKKTEEMGRQPKTPKTSKSGKAGKRGGEPHAIGKEDEGQKQRTASWLRADRGESEKKLPG